MEFASHKGAQEEQTNAGPSVALGKHVNPAHVDRQREKLTQAHLRPCAGKPTQLSSSPRTQDDLLYSCLLSLFIIDRDFLAP